MKLVRSPVIQWLVLEQSGGVGEEALYSFWVGQGSPCTSPTEACKGIAMSASTSTLWGSTTQRYREVRRARVSCEAGTVQTGWVLCSSFLPLSALVHAAPLKPLSFP